MLNRTSFNKKPTLTLAFVVCLMGGTTHAQDCIQLAASETEPGINLGLGIRFEEIDTSLAIPACETALSSSRSAANLFRLGRTYLKADQRDEAMALFVEASVLNFPPAMSSLSYMYLYDNDGGNENLDMGLQLARQAAEADDRGALEIMGSLYADGEFVRRDDDKAFEYFSRAASQESQYAHYNLGMFYKTGRQYIPNHDPTVQILPDILKAIEHFEIALELGNISAALQLGEIYLEPRASSHDKEKAQEYFLAAATSENVEAMAQVGYLYLVGRGFEQNNAFAMDWLQKAAELGSPDANANLAFMYFNSVGTPRNLFGGIKSSDRERAVELYRIAADLGNRDAEFFMGTLLTSDGNLEANISKGVDYLQASANQLHPEALALIGDFRFSGRYLSKDLEMGFSLWRDAAREGSERSAIQFMQNNELAPAFLIAGFDSFIRPSHFSTNYGRLVYGHYLIGDPDFRFHYNNKLNQRAYRVFHTVRREGTTEESEQATKVLAWLDEQERALERRNSPLTAGEIILGLLVVGIVVSSFMPDDPPGTMQPTVNRTLPFSDVDIVNAWLP